MKVFCRGFTASSLVGSLVLLVSSASAFAPVSTTQSFARSNLHLASTQDKTNKLFWMSTPPRRPIIAYMADSASTTAEEPPQKNSEESKSFLKRITKVIPPANELQKLVPLGLMFFCILFNYTILRDTKDVLMVRRWNARQYDTRVRRRACHWRSSLNSHSTLLYLYRSRHPNQEPKLSLLLKPTSICQSPL